jgi:glycosyltransferase involved in cell wall biosynthesis
MKISVCIPCHVNDFSDLKNLILDLNSQSRKPDEVIIFIKPVSDSFLEDKNLTLDNEIQYKFLTENKYSTMAYAKNRCIEEATGDIICLMDSDDTLDEKKVEFVENFMKEHDRCDIMVHGYFYNDKNSVRTQSVDVQDLTYEECLPDPNALGIMSTSKQELHHAHSSFRRKVLLENSFPEKDSAYRIDDSVFLKMLLKKGFNILFSKHKLISFNKI